MYVSIFVFWFLSPNSVQWSPSYVLAELPVTLWGPDTSWKTVVQKMIVCVRPSSSKWLKFHSFHVEIAFRHDKLVCICAGARNASCLVGGVSQAMFTQKATGSLS